MSEAKRREPMTRAELYSFLELLTAWDEGRIEGFVAWPRFDLLEFYVRDVKGEEVIHSVAVPVSYQKLMWTRRCFPVEPAPSWPQVQAKAIELFPDLGKLSLGTDGKPNLSSQHWDRIRRAAGLSDLEPPLGPRRRGRPPRQPGQPSKGRKKRR
jgi:hypothetical protein